MKIICIGRNYSEHAKELNNPLPTIPMFFLKPETALLKDSQDFYLPDFSNDIHHEIELVIRICKQGKNIQKQFAHRYYDRIGLGIDFTARDIQENCKQKGHPWEIAKAFDGSAPVGEFIPVTALQNKGEILFELKINGETRQSGNSRDMIFSFDHIIAYVSQFITLKTGDLIFTGTPKGVAAIKANDLIEGFLNGQKLITFKVK
jgi:2-keto-4-pentenoate hydratase/2-oxohepta-3-ene-1,7-dioic acid hydratase in catechol pathway